MSEFDIGSFRFDSIVLELRYEHAYLLWDNAGRIWSEFAQLHPDMISEKVEPNLQKFTDGRSFEYQVQTDRARISQLRPETNLKKFSNISNSFFSIVANRLELRALSRIGLRAQYFRVFRSEEEATSSLIDTGLIRAPKGKTFNIEPRFKDVGVNIRSEDDQIGARVAIQVARRKVEFSAPIAAPELESKEFEELGVMYDVDYYTASPTLIAQFKPVDWIEQTHRLIRRDCKSYLGGV